MRSHWSASHAGCGCQPALPPTGPSAGWSPTPDASSWDNGTVEPPWKHAPRWRPSRRDLVRPHQGGGTRATVPGPSSTHSNTAPILEAVVFPPVPNLGIGTLTQDDDVIMENAAMVPQASSAHTTAMVSSTSSVHDTAPVPLALMVYATATVPQALSVNAAVMVPQASPVNAAATVLEASSAYDTAPVPMASSVNATATVPQASSVTAAATVPLASSATTSTSMDVNAPHASACDMTEEEERIMAEIYE